MMRALDEGTGVHMYTKYDMYIIPFFHCSGSQYAQYTQAMQMLFLEVVSVLCFGKVSYSDPESELICFLMDRIFKGDKTQDIAALTWEKGDSVPVVRTVLLQLILSRR